MSAAQNHVGTRRSCARGLVHCSSKIAVRPDTRLRSARASFVRTCSMPGNVPAPFRPACEAVPPPRQTPASQPGEWPRFVIAYLSAQYSSAPAMSGTCVVVRESLATSSNFEFGNSAGSKKYNNPVTLHRAVNKEKACKQLLKE